MDKQEVDQFEKTRKTSVKEGSFSALSVGVGENNIVPFGLKLGASNVEIGFLSSFIGLFGPISQIYGSKLMEKYHRKNLLIFFATLQALSLLFFVGIGVIFLNSLFSDLVIPFLIVSYLMYAVFGSLVSPPWFSLMGDVVPEKGRGRYFSRRNKIGAAFSLIGTIFAAIWLDYTNDRQIVIYGFMFLFLISSISRLISAYLFSKHNIPKLEIEKSYYFSYWKFIKKAPTNNFGKFTIYVALMMLAVSISSPFFAVYMLNELHFSYFWFTIVNISSGFFTVIMIPFWGRFSDKYGNKEVLRVSSLVLPIIPMLWLFSKSPIYLIFVPQLITGIIWSGFNLSSSNFIYDAVTTQRRGIVHAYYSITVGVGVFIGALIGGFVTQHATINFMSIFLFVFLLSGLLRALVIAIMLGRIKEVRQELPEAKKNPLLYFLEIKPVYGVIKPRMNFITKRINKKKD